MVLRSETWNKLGHPISPGSRNNRANCLLLHLDDERGFDAVKFRRCRVQQVLGALRVSRARGFFESAAKVGEPACA